MVPPKLLKILVAAVAVLALWYVLGLTGMGLLALVGGTLYAIAGTFRPLPPFKSTGQAKAAVILVPVVSSAMLFMAAKHEDEKRLADLKEANPAAYYAEYARKEIAAKEREDRAARRERCSDAVSAFTFAQSAMRERLKAPSTAKLASITESTTQDLECGVYAVRSYVDAQNSFGAMIRTHFVARVRHLGDDRWTLEQMETR